MPYLVYCNFSVLVYCSNRFFLLEFLGFSTYKIMSFAKIDTFTSSFLIQMPFLPPVVLARTYKTMLNKSGVSRHLCLLFQRKSFKFF